VTTAAQSQRLPVRIFNGVQHLRARLGRPKAGFVASADAMREAARKAVGADDFGDAAFEEGYRVLLEAYDREARLTPFGRMMVDAQLLGILKNRLVAERCWKEQPAILHQEIKQPIFILGLPRTGTTALHHLLGADPRNQVLEYWIAAAPGPRPPRDEWAGDPRFKEAVRGLKTMYYLDPHLKAIHLMTADGPEECRHLLQQNFTDDTFDCNSTIPSYSAWYGRYDMTPTYARHRDLLKLIGSTDPGRRWLLKYPVHMRNLRTVLTIYPDACFVQTHRDPGKVIPSICSLVAGWRGIYEHDPDRRAIAAWQLELWAQSLEHGMEVRREVEPSRFFDLHFREVLADPVGAARRIYDHFGLGMTDDGEARLRRWHQENPQGKHGEHRYTAADFGLTDRIMGDRFAAYVEHFGVERETAR
jgi:Sulfotransferase family